ncbi:hypothetical protein TRFO_40362 [Tritrichomonas foetus]|uniref:DUF1015 domain-containing protein n=1 Tax=Tritrichomonas foetus TaxID=1144522 RepID=A0A1J4J7Z0_9EUKA|nr:hypothetical protein TRFO_40362 [Tritrichomonas foetus]|eukprot:OHS93348.1 hypothetical protein TRFO_40362 [Tritrichomonas foetus]
MSGIIVKPFKGYVPPADSIGGVIAPPYDVLDRQEALEMGTSRPNSVIHVTRPEIEFPGVESTHKDVYQRGADNLNKWIENKLFVQEDKPGFYAYKQVLGDHEQVGLFALCSLEQYKKGIIKKHELTRKAPEEDRTITTRIQNANVGSVFLAYRGDQHQKLRDYVRSLCQGEPDRSCHLGFDNTEHQLWLINDEESVKEINNLFADVDTLYIADGHHRCAAAYNLYEEKKAQAGDSFVGDEPYCYVMAAIFADSELCVIDYNRVVTGVTMDTKELLNQIEAQGFKISKLTGEEKPTTYSFLPFHHARPLDLHTFSLYIRGQWYKLEFTGKYMTENPVDKIDSKILTDYVLTPIFGITDLRSAKNIKFIGGTRGIHTLEEEAKDENTLAIAVPPIQIQQLFDVSDSGAMMPPKSTWFVPKLATGMVIRRIE